MNACEAPAWTQACVYCWPAFVTASHWDERGHACCDKCASNAKRVCQVPTFLFKPLPFGVKLQ